MKKYGEYLKNSSKEKVGDEAKNIISKTSPSKISVALPKL